MLFNIPVKKILILLAALLLVSSCATVDTTRVYSAGGSRAEAVGTASSSERPFAEAAGASQPQRAEAPSADPAVPEPAPAEETPLPEPSVPDEAEPEPAAVEEVITEPEVQPAPDKNISIPVVNTVPIVMDVISQSGAISQPAEPVYSVSAVQEAEESGEEELPVPEPVSEPEPAIAEPEPVIAQEMSPEAPQMDIWMVQLMVASVVIVILFTIATAIRSAHAYPLSPGLSIAVTLLITAIPIIISALAGGMSWMWALYLVLLFSYMILRGRGPTGSR